MSTLLDPTPAPPPSARTRSRQQLSGAPDSQAIRIGIAGTLLIHLIFLLIAPHLEPRIEEGYFASPDDSGRTFDIEMDSETFFAPPPPQQFVEVNPDAPENVPDRTDNFGARNQQVAQETPTPEGESESPATEGQTEIESTAIVSGDRAEQEAEPAPVVPPTPEEVAEINEAIQEAARRALDPLPGEDRVEGDNPDGFGSSVVPLPTNPVPIPERIEGDPNATEAEGAASGSSFRVDPSRPAPRPSLASSNLRPAFVTERVDGTSNLGVIAHNALKTEYGAYLSRIIETVDRQWSNDIRGKWRAGFSYPLAGSRVKVKFKLMKSGEVAIVEVDGTADTLWSRVAVDAIAQRAPYGEWTDDMIAVLGESTEITFTFHYQ
jgi:hypothetical protein